MGRETLERKILKKDGPVYSGIHSNSNDIFPRVPYHAFLFSLLKKKKFSFKFFFEKKKKSIDRWPNIWPSDRWYGPQITTKRMASLAKVSQLHPPTAPAPFASNRRKRITRNFYSEEKKKDFFKDILIKFNSNRIHSHGWCKIISYFILKKKTKQNKFISFSRW